jgi:hypothetical protein
MGSGSEPKPKTPVKQPTVNKTTNKPKEVDKPQADTDQREYNVQFSILLIWLMLFLFTYYLYNLAEKRKVINI